MPVDPNASVQITALSWVPPFARGLVRDLRVRWALEEAGIPYSVRTFDGRTARPRDYFEEQPWGQVPCYRDGKGVLFESGAIVFHIGERSEALLPHDEMGRARALAWIIAALNSVEPAIGQLLAIDLFNPGESWGETRRPAVVGLLERRLDPLAERLANREWLEDRFTAGDLMMTAVFRMLDYTDLLTARPSLAAYKERCQSRPAFQRALAAQFADFVEDEAVAAE